MTPTQLWLIAAVVLFILEVLTPGFVLANFGVACLAAAIAAWFHLTVAIQVIVFCVVSLLSFFTVRPFLNRFAFDKHASTPMNADALIGRVVVVTEAINGDELGRVQVDGDSWRARLENGGAAQAGARVVVVSLDSTTLVVRIA